jgi:hypothetical protein
MAMSMFDGVPGSYYHYCIQRIFSCAEEVGTEAYVWKSFPSLAVLNLDDQRI